MLTLSLFYITFCIYFLMINESRKNFLVYVNDRNTFSATGFTVAPSSYLQLSVWVMCDATYMCLVLRPNGSPSPGAAATMLAPWQFCWASSNMENIN